MQHTPSLNDLEDNTEFVARHIGPSEAEQKHMLESLGLTSRQALIDQVVPEGIRRRTPMELPAAVSEATALQELKVIARKNRVLKSFIGQGYYNTHTPGVILRNVIENPAWYTAYTPYQAEISQGRMEALINFQTLVTDLTGMPIANASLLDEATAAAEAMTLAKRCVQSKSNTLLVAHDCHPQTVAVLQTRAAPLNIDIVVARDPAHWNEQVQAKDYFAAMVQYPGTWGHLVDHSQDAARIHEAQAAFIVCADLLALTLLRPPGEWGADIVVGSTQRLGMPMGNGGPHAAYMATQDAYKRSMPGRLVGVSVDAHGAPTYRLALQTREQHIRREKATSNICTAQVLPAVVASMYAVYHGPAGLRRIALRVATLTQALAMGLKSMGFEPLNQTAFDTLTYRMATDQAKAIVARACGMGMNFRLSHETDISISIDETTVHDDLVQIWQAFGPSSIEPDLAQIIESARANVPDGFARSTPYLTHPVFNSHHSETQMLRYLRRLSDKDLALDRSMIPLGSCTMKLNATSEMIPVTWPEFAHIHPFAPADQRLGYAELDAQLQAWLCQATGYEAVSLQPNAGSQGEYAGLLAIAAYHAAKGEHQRKVCLIPSSAHGTNPASAQMVGMQVVVVACDDGGNIDMADLQAKCQQHAETLAAIMITYPSTHGVFEAGIEEVCECVPRHGGRVYVDGANMNAMVGLAAPGAFGGDVSHLNLHKTFCIPHGGGGPGVGPVCVVADLAPYLPGRGVGPVSATPLGNASVLPISWMYCRMMGAAGLTEASEVAILSANYISHRLADAFPTLYASASGRVAHECILDLRPLKESAGIMAEDVAKRLIDFGFHAPTLSFPVANTLMVEPTESEDLTEIERFIEAMLAIRAEIAQVESGQWPRDDNPLKHAPHTARHVSQTEWAHPYTREIAAYPVPGLRHAKYWSPVSRVDNVYGDRNLFCSCVPIETTSER